MKKLNFIRRVALIVLWTCSGSAYSQTAELATTDTLSLEQKVKAAYVFNFARFTNWPASKLNQDNKLFIGIMGSDSFTESLRQSLDGVTIEGKTVSVVNVASTEDLSNIHILYVARSEHKAIQPLIAAIRRKPILSVSELTDFVQKGGMIRLRMEGSKVGFVLNLREVERAGLKVSSQMLQYAQIVD